MLTAMKPDDDREIRVSFTFYPSDTKALRRLTLALRDGGLDVARTDTLRSLLHTTSETDMLRLAAERLKAEANDSLPHNETVDERFTARVRQGAMRKIDRVIDNLARKDLDADRTFIIRAVLHGDHEPKTLIRSTKKFLEEFPDRRTRVGRAAE